MPRRRRSLEIDALEVRSFLSGMTYSLTTDQSSYEVGQAIRMTFTETNTSSQPVTVSVAPTDFSVSLPGGEAIWQSDPDNANQPPTSETLQPGQSLTQTATWDGTITSSSSTTPYYPEGPGSFVVTNPNAPQGTSATFQVASPFTDTLTTDRSTYQLGQPVQMTFTMTNTSDEPAQFNESPANEAFIVEQDGQMVWRSIIDVSYAISSEILQPGQTLTLHATWDGTVASTSSIATTSGSFVVINSLAPQGLSASFQIQSPLSYSLALPEYNFAFGQAINMSYTVTNTSGQPATFTLAPADFIVTLQDNTTVWESDPGASSQTPTTQTLQPGQSLTETATWNGVANEGALSGTDAWNSLGVSVLGAPTGLSQEFEITSPLSQQVTTDQDTYSSGEPVQVTAIETNTSDQVLTIFNGNDVFTVLGNDGVTLPAVDTSSSDPVVTLQPGQSQTFTATWNQTGADGAPSPPGDYTIAFQDAFQEITSPQFTIAPSPPGSTNPGSGPAPGSSPSVVPTPSPVSTPPTTPTPSAQAPSPITATLTAKRSTNPSGHPVHMTVSLKNTTREKVHLAASSRTATIAVLEGSTVISRTTEALAASKRATLKAGKSVHLAAIWNGKPNQSGLEKVEPGTYTIDVDGGDYDASTTITIEGPGRKCPR